MKLIIITYFEQKDGMCGVGFDQIKNMDLFDVNPPFIDVANDIYNDTHYVLNSHEGGGYVKPIEGVNCWSVDTFVHVGVWKIKYKS